MFHRVRATLDPLGERAGHTLILRREGSYVWNSDIPVELDIDEFDRLCKAGANARSEEKRIEKWMEALPRRLSCQAVQRDMGGAHRRLLS